MEDDTAQCMSVVAVRRGGDRQDRHRAQFERRAIITRPYLPAPSPATENDAIPRARRRQSSAHLGARSQSPRVRSDVPKASQIEGQHARRRLREKEAASHRTTSAQEKTVRLRDNAIHAGPCRRHQMQLRQRSCRGSRDPQLDRAGGDRILHLRVGVLRGLPAGAPRVTPAD